MPDEDRDPIEKITHEDEARRKFEQAAETGRRAHADPEPDSAAPEDPGAAIPERERPDGG